MKRFCKECNIKLKSTSDSDLKKHSGLCRSCSKLSKRNPMWKGNQVKLPALHRWVIARFPKTSLCQKCNIVPPYDLANISQKYKRDVTDFEWLCRSCHMSTDDRLQKLRYSKGRIIYKGENAQERSLKMGKSKSFIQQRIWRGWSIKDAFTKPPKS